MTRIFKIGSTRIVEDDSMRHLDNEAVREILKLSFPEVKQATIREREENGVRFVEFLPRPGRKG
jgi:hypothetical protein